VKVFEGATLYSNPVRESGPPKTPKDSQADAFIPHKASAFFHFGI
jgi:hypothetical protein